MGEIKKIAEEFVFAGSNEEQKVIFIKLVLIRILR